MAAAAPQVGVVAPQSRVVLDNLLAGPLFAVVPVEGADSAGGKQTVFGLLSHPALWVGVVVSRGGRLVRAAGGEV